MVINRALSTLPTGSGSVAMIADGSHHADAIGVDLEHFADDSANQRLVPLLGRERMGGRCDGAANIDIYAAGIGKRATPDAGDC
jgi:hypothetical protein